MLDVTCRSLFLPKKVIACIQKNKINIVVKPMFSMFHSQPKKKTRYHAQNKTNVNRIVKIQIAMFLQCIQLWWSVVFVFLSSNSFLKSVIAWKKNFPPLFTYFFLIVMLLNAPCKL